MVTGTEHVSRIVIARGGPPGQGYPPADPSLASAATRDGPADGYWQPTLDSSGGAALNIINLSDYKLSGDEMTLISKGLTFFPILQHGHFWNHQRFASKLILKSLYAKPKQTHISSRKENQAIEDLVSLLEDQEQKDLIDSIDIESLLAMHTIPTSIQGKSVLKKKSNKFPSLNSN